MLPAGATWKGGGVAYGSAGAGAGALVDFQGDYASGVAIPATQTGELVQASWFSASGVHHQTFVRVTVQKVVSLRLAG